MVAGWPRVAPGVLPSAFATRAHEGDRRVAHREDTFFREAAMDVPADRHVVPGRCRPARHSHARDVGQAYGLRILQVARGGALDEAEPADEAAFAVRKQVARVTTGPGRQAEEGPFEPPNQGAGRGQRIGRLSEGPEVHSTDPLKPTYYVAFRGFCPI